MKRTGISGLVVSAVVLGALASPAVAGVDNGGFETGTFRGWETQSSDEGNWFIYQGGLGGASTRGQGEGFPAPPRGDHAARVEQGGPSLNILHQVLKADDGERDLSLLLAYENGAGVFETPRSFDFDGDPNQQLRIDLLDPDAGLKSLRPQDILATVFRTREGDAPSRGYEKETIDLKNAGVEGKFRLRIAEVDNQNGFPVGVDAVKIR